MEKPPEEALKKFSLFKDEWLHNESNRLTYAEMSTAYALQQTAGLITPEQLKKKLNEASDLIFVEVGNNGTENALQTIANIDLSRFL